MAPELYKGETAGRTADIYSLGLVMYRMLNKNKGPFLPPDARKVSQGEADRALIRRMAGDELPPPVNASPEMAKIILKACESRPQDRYQSGEELRGALAALPKGDPAESGAHRPADPPAPPNPAPSGETQDNASFGLTQPRDEDTVPVFFGGRESELEAGSTLPSDEYIRHMQEKREKEEAERREAEKQEAEKREAEQREAEKREAEQKEEETDGEAKKDFDLVATVVALGAMAFFLLFLFFR